MDSTHSSLAYRPDVDGLRAVSVLAVLAFHAGFPGFPGGFVGVDVFFVISGYLITSLLLAEHHRAGRISLVGFWARRIRRLAPALLFVLCAVLLASPFALERISGEVGSLSQAAVATVLINSNHFFYQAAGDYFGAAAGTNPLLHIWSLSVEEQFYLLWPVSIALILKRPQRVRIAAVVGVVLGSSFALSCWWTAHDVSRGFYLMPSRAWELMAGATLAVAAPSRSLRLGRWRAELLAGCGLALIVGSTVALSGDAWFPGPMAVLPVSGAALLLWSGAAYSGNLVSRALASRPMVYLGKLSYPLYLWHWPVLVFLRSRRLYEQAPWQDASSLAVSLLFAAFTYEVIERRTWSFLRNDRRRTILHGLVGSAAVLGIALLVGAWARFGWGYTPDERRLDAARSDMPSLDCMFRYGLPSSAAVDACFPVGAGPTLLLWGDSHANHWNGVLGPVASEVGAGLATLTMNGCRPLPGPVGDAECVAFNEMVLRNFAYWRRERGLAGIVLSARWPEGTGTLVPSIDDREDWRNGTYFDRRARSQQQALAYLREELRDLMELTRREELRLLVVLSSPVQRWSAVHCLSLKRADQCFVALEEMREYAQPAEEVIRLVAAGYENVRVLDPKEFMCSAGRCPAVIDGIIAFTDDDHVSLKFSLSRRDRFRQELSWLVSGHPGRSAAAAAPVARLGAGG